MTDDRSSKLVVIWVTILSITCHHYRRHHHHHHWTENSCRTRVAASKHDQPSSRRSK